MHGPLATPTSTPANTPVLASEKPLVQQPHEEAEEEEEKEEPKVSQQDDGMEVTAFKYRSRVSVLSRSFRSPESVGSRLVALHRMSEESLGPQLEGVNQVPPDRDEEGEKENVSNRFRQASMSEESSTCNSTEGSKIELSNMVGTELNKREELVKSPPTNKSHPYSRRIDLSPRTLSPTANHKSRPKILAYGKTDPEGRMAKSGPAMLSRRSTLSSIQPGRRLLPAPPMRRGSVKPMRHVSSLSSERPAISEKVSDNHVDGSNGSETVNSFAEELVSSLETVAKKEKSLQESESEAVSESDGAKDGCVHTTTPRGSSSSINSKEDQLPANSRVKHTVQYNSVAAFSKGE